MTKSIHAAFAFSLLTLMLVSCSSDKSPSKISKPLITGADQTEKYLPRLKGKRIGLVANQTSTIHGKPSVDVLLATGVKVVKIFGPEHGFRGNASNGAKVADEIDPKTGIPIISLYAKKRKPTKKDLEGIDLMIFDVQDMGVRFYTKINTLKYVMEACAENTKPLIVLDRPNPNGYLIDGPILDMKLRSGIGQFPIPIAHGMTIGEFARMINGEGWLTNNLKCNLSVVPLANYRHDMPYTLPIYPSPNLNTAQSVMLYPSLCLFEGTIVSQGRGTQMPFTVLGAPLLKGKYEFSFTPASVAGMSEKPLHLDKTCYGLDLRNYDIEQLRKTGQLNLSWLIEFYKAYPEKEKFFDSKQSKAMGSFDRLAGTRDLKKEIIAGVSEKRIRKTWEPGLTAYKEMRKKYLLYP